jgi:hypothetical protein
MLLLLLLLLLLLAVASSSLPSLFHVAVGLVVAVVELKATNQLLPQLLPFRHIIHKGLVAEILLVMHRNCLHHQS